MKYSNQDKQVMIGRMREGVVLALMAVLMCGQTLIDSVSFGRQDPDVSYGRYPDGGGDWMFFGRPSPGSQNTDPYLGVVEDPLFSHDRGFFDEPFSVTLTTATDDATLYYTLDGSNPLDPVRGNSQYYIKPISITKTTCLRAVALKDGWKPSRVQTRTYLFIRDVIGQPKNPSGFPTPYGSWSDYEMDPDITNHPTYGPLMKEALLSLPVLSIVMNNADLFGSKGIYANPSSRGPSWERPTSVEWICPNGQPGFQIDCGIQIQGGAFRTMSAKHSLRLSFKGMYGATRLRYPLFGEDAAKEFDTITLRAGANDGYSWNAARYTEQYTRDEFGRALQRATGNVGSHGTFVHLYLNGLYWGLYNPVERPDASFSASYYGGEKEDWDALHNGGSTEVLEGDLNAWNQMLNLCRTGLTSNEAYQRLQGNNTDGTRNPEYPHFLDVPEYIDYLIVNLWGGNWDWPWKNWYAGRDRTATGTGFKFYCWDFENTMGNNLGRSPLDKNALNNDFSSAGEPHQYLRQNAEYRLLFADHVHRFFFNEGVLTPETLIRRYADLTAGVELAIICESARWGDQFWNPPLTLEDWYDSDPRYNDGRAGLGWILNYYLPQRTAIVLQQFKDAGLYPKADAPVYNINGSFQHGGHVATTDSFSMTIPQGTTGRIYYTLDGSDPRSSTTESTPSGTTLAAADSAKRVLVPTAAVSDTWQGGGPFDDSAWTLVTGSPGGIGFDYTLSSGGDYIPYVGLDVYALMSGKTATCYIRIPFTVEPTHLAQFKSLILKMLYDDGFIAYLNGMEIQRTHFNGTPAWDSRANSSHDAGTTPASFDITEFLAKLRTGDNILAIHGLNSSAASSDLLFWAELAADKTAVPAGMGVSPSAIEYKGPFTLVRSADVKARVLSDTTWSALNEAVFAVGPVAESLRISEIMYHPQDTGHPDDPNAEFIELTNAGSQAINLNRVRFTKGIDFTFGDVTVEPNGYILVVRDLAAFTVRYGQGLPVAGTYTGSLDNGGERLRLQDAADQVIHDFQYSDEWYDATDGFGLSLTVTHPAGIGDDPEALAGKALWQPSVILGGSPGR